jgi:multiple antibiotic resistance protein
MNDIAYAFTLCFVTLGPLKTIPAFFLVTREVDRPTVVRLAIRSSILATLIVLFIALVASGVLVTWRVSLDAMAIAGGLLLLATSIKTLSGFTLTEIPARPDSTTGAAASRSGTQWLGRPVLSPLAIPAIVTPVGVVVILCFAGAALGDVVFQQQLVGLLLAIMAVNFVAMLCAGRVMQLVGLPVLQVIGWVFSALQAGLAIQAVINAVRNLV